VRDAVGFHCQQAAEKYLKALLCEAGLHIPHIHDLDQILVLLLSHHPSLAPLKRILVALSHYAVDYRYPGWSTSTRQMRAALRHAERVRIEVRTILGLRP
jgi:HEPN domain-containing protein